ncbi:MAG: urea carboxylase [Chthoniobacterales bacterium]
MFTKLLIANRGAISRRISRTLKNMNIGSVAVFSEADADSIHVREADESILLGPAAVSESYLRVDKILEAALKTGAGAIHPGYGFLSENADFAEACENAGIAFAGPTPSQMRVFGLKHTAREIAGKCGVPLLPGTGLLENANIAADAAEKIGFPVMLKSTAGGGGIGMKVCWSREELLEAFATVERMSQNNFKESGIFLEKFVAHARHIEVQIFGDGKGRVVALGERDCSAQRRNQKVIEETPAPNINDEQRAQLFAAAVQLGEAVNYRSAGTVEFVFDADSGEFYFLEVNTRLQVEHGVTEEVCGIDLVEWMVRLAQGDVSFLDEYVSRSAGHSIQVRIYAEDPAKNFQPSCGLLTEVRVDPAARCETWVESGTEVTPYYDPMLAKIIVHAADRPTAIARMQAVLASSSFAGIETNLDYLRMVVATPEFSEGRIITRSLADLTYTPLTIDVLEAGAMTTVQDYPGRVGYWNVGVPPSGPMDPLAHRLANRLLGNAPTAATLEVVMTGPTLRFNHATSIAICGADFQVELDGNPLPLWQSVAVAAGSKLRMRNITGPGARGYIAVAGGFDVPLYLGSRSTFTLGKFGGHGGRALRPGDVLHFFGGTSESNSAQPLVYANHWQIGVLYGPHGAPDFFTDDDIEIFFSTDWKVHYNSNPTGVRLIGPKPKFARTDGGEAGLHPSNIHDNAYAVGTVDFTGDMPIILGPDGPSLGGFVCPATIVQAELWKMGQLKAGDTVRFIPLTHQKAVELESAQDASILNLTSLEGDGFPELTSLPSPVLFHRPAGENRIEVRHRVSGDKYLLVEYGPLVLDIALRFRVHALMQWLEHSQILGIIDLTPGIRSLQIHYDSRALPLHELTSLLRAAEMELPPTDQIEVPSRIVHLPLSWDDPATRLAIEKYIQSVRADAPWCPSNIEFIRRINGLSNIDEVRDIVFNASYLVLGLGDVYLGAPVATPLDPRHRLVTTKYNPARTWTPENAVGIGGAYMCVYGMEGPGGYQFVGRTVQMWNAWRATSNFTGGKPWLLRFFDQVRFYPVTAGELLQHRADFLNGRFVVRTEEETFRLADYTAFLERESDSIAEFRLKQRSAFAEERDRWVAAGQNIAASEPEPEIISEELVLPPGGRAVAAHLPGSIWQVLVNEGETVAEGDKLLIIESMKMETAITAPCAGLVSQLLVAKGRTVDPGQNLLVLIET